MKKLLALLTFVFMLTACSSDDAPIQDTTPDYLPDPPPSILIFEGNKSNFSVTQEYIAANISEFDALSDDFSRFENAAANFADYDIFMIGECHRVAGNSDSKLFLIKYLHEKFGVRYIFEEVSFASADVINLRLAEGDTEYFRSIKEAHPSNLYIFDFFEQLCEYNKTLSDDEKIIVIGTDIEHEPHSSYYYIHGLLSEKMANDRIISDVSNYAEIFLDLAEYYVETSVPGDNPNYAVEPLNSLLENINMNRKFYEEFLGDKLFNLEMTIENLLQGNDCYSSLVGKYGGEMPVRRESYLVKNFIKLYEHYGMPKLLSQYGGAHVDLSGSTAVPYFSLATYLNYDYPATIGLLYNNCEQYVSSGGNDFVSFTHNFLLYKGAVPAKEHFAIIDFEHTESPALQIKDEIKYYSKGFMYYIILNDLPIEK